MITILALRLRSWALLTAGLLGASSSSLVDGQVHLLDVQADLLDVQVDFLGVQADLLQWVF